MSHTLLAIYLFIYLVEGESIVDLVSHNLLTNYLPIYLVDGESIVDLVSHTLLTALATTQPGRDWGLKMQVSYLFIKL